MDNKVLKIKDKLNNLKPSSAINPHKHWNLLVISFLILSGCLIVVSIYLLYGIKNEQIFNSDSNLRTDSSVINESMLGAFKEYVKDKEKRENSIKLNPTLYKDPSI